MRFKSAAGGRWIAASTLLVLSLIAAPAMAQQGGGQNCNAAYFDSLTLGPATGQTLYEFGDAAPYEPTTVEIRASRQLPNNGNPSYEFEQTYGPSVTLSAGNDARSRRFVTRDFGPSGATLGFKVIARCNGVAVKEATGSVNIINRDRPPVATPTATPTNVRAGDAVALAANATDPDGDAITYTWSQVARPNVPTAVLADPTAANTGFTAPQASADYTLEFEVTARSNALSATGTVLVNVTAANLPPQVSLTCGSPTGAPDRRHLVDEGADLVLDGSGSYDPERRALSYAWSVVEADAGLDLQLDSETGNSVFRPAPLLGLGMVGLVEVQLRVTEVDDPNVFVDATCSFMIVDATAPVLGLPATLELDADSADGTDVAAYLVSAADNVDGDLSSVVACDPPAPHLFPLGVNAVTCAVEDSAGNGAIGSFDVDVQDRSPPVFGPISDVAIEGNALGGGVLTYNSPIAIDKVDGQVAASCAPVSGTLFTRGSTPVVCTATDTAGHTAEATFQATVHDTLPPELSLPGNMSIEATGPDGAIVSFVATALDIVDGDVPVSCTPGSPGTFGLGTTTVNCRANDSNFREGFPEGNVADGSFSITVVDMTAPTLSGVSGDLFAYATSSAGAVVSWNSPQASDLVDGIRNVTCTPGSGSTFPLGTTTVICSASDTRGNTASQSFTVTVRYGWTGFFQPIDNDKLNRTKAGSAVPAKFNLGGNMGLDVFASGYPRSVAISCSTNTPVDDIETTVNAGGSSLNYDATTGQYNYVWKTDKGWGGTCRQLQMKLKDGSYVTYGANFQFTR
jgi:hypothetical protein